jgi:hypothetical protein
MGLFIGMTSEAWEQAQGKVLVVTDKSASDHSRTVNGRERHRQMFLRRREIEQIRSSCGRWRGGRDRTVQAMCHEGGCLRWNGGMGLSCEIRMSTGFGGSGCAACRGLSQS